MTYTEVVKQVAEVTGTSRAEAERHMDAFFRVVIQALRNGQRVNMVGFGSFEPRMRASQCGIHPRTGERFQVGAHIVPSFRAGKKLRAEVKEGENND